MHFFLDVIDLEAKGFYNQLESDFDDFPPKSSSTPIKFSTNMSKRQIESSESPQKNTRQTTGKFQ